MSKDLTLENLGELQFGLAGPAVNAAIGEALNDINQRPFLDADRKIKIELALRPVMGAGGELIGITSAMSIDPRFPPMKLSPEVLSVSITPDANGKGVVRAHLAMPQTPQTPLFNRDGDAVENGNHN